ncbi:uncharacterized protein LOC119306325 isoform X2 [Triticum dicoccoides]|uniref:uncharacterized protein LOC119306325 isoform X2 n=1 Tax=Triticum dicoccoides TaxID=85692 RepID=UPI0003D553BC|nr:uncharacterized protein LOC119306325 isoform X2 [Triticum dicoccoides]XP_044393861.1 uncharacterized protein LOC123117085 isoform X1 [Triticum aestivum]
MDAGDPLLRATPLLSRASSAAATAASSAAPFCLAQPPSLPCLPPESSLFHPKNCFFFLPPRLLLAATPSLLALMEEAWPALGPTACDAAFPPPPRPPWRGARRKTVAKESSAQAVSRIVSSCANSSGLAVAAVDANAAISGGAALASTAGRLVTVLEEVCDDAARRRLALLPTPVETVDLTPEFVKRGRLFT